MKKLHMVALGSLVIAAVMLLFAACEPEGNTNTPRGGRRETTPPPPSGESNDPVRPLELKAYLDQDDIYLIWGKVKVDNLVGYRIEYSYNDGDRKVFKPQDENGENSITTGTTGYDTSSLIPNNPALLTSEEDASASSLASARIKWWVIPITGKGERVEGVIEPTTIEYSADYDEKNFPCQRAHLPYNKFKKPNSIVVNWYSCTDEWNGTPGTYDVLIRNDIPESSNTWEHLTTVNASHSQYTVEDLKPNTRYHFRVIAVNAEGYANYPPSTLPIITPPAAPIISQVRTDNGRVTLVITASSDNGTAAPIDYYEVQVSPPPGRGSATNGTQRVKPYEGATAVEVPVTGLTNGVEYTFTATATATNSPDHEDPTSDKSAAVTATPADAEGNDVQQPELKAYLVSYGINLIWDKAKVDNLFGYRIEYSYNDGDRKGYDPENKDDENSITAGLSKYDENTLRINVSYLESSQGEGETALHTKMQLWVIPITKSSNSAPYERVKAGSNVIASTIIEYNSADLEKFTKFPSNFDLSADNETTNSIQLLLRPPERFSWGGTPGTYTILYRLFDGWENLATVNASHSQYTVKDLKPNTSYDFRVIAVNAEGKANNNSVETYVTKPVAPIISRVRNSGSGQVTLTIIPSSDNGRARIDHYEVQVSPDPGGGSAASGTQQVDTNDIGSVVINGLTNDTEYTFTATMTNSAGTSDKSAAVTATPTMPTIQQ